jgi:hypothetical protein
MVGYTSQGASDSQFYDSPPDDVWEALVAHLGSRKYRSFNGPLRRLEVNLGMSALTGNCIASISVEPAPGGAIVRFSGRMGAFSGMNIAGQRRIEDERTRLFAGIADWLVVNGDAEDEGEAAEVMGGVGIVAELQKLADLRMSGALTDDEFVAAKARLLA